VLSQVVLVGAAAALVCLAMTVVKVRDLVRDPHNRALRYLVAALVALSASMTFQPLAQWLDYTLGVLDVGRLLANCAALIGAATGQAALLYLIGRDHATDRRVRRRCVLGLAAVVAVVVLFLMTPARYDVTDPYVTSHAYYYATPTPAQAPYQFVFLAYLLWSVQQFALLTHRYAQVAPRPLLRIGLHLVTMGFLLVLVYVLTKVTASLVTERRPDVADTLNRLIVPCYLTAALCVMLGVTLPAWGRRVGLDRLADRLIARRHCRLLRPLWTRVHQAAPHVALLPHPPSPTLRRARMVVEILDGYVHLGLWTDVAVLRQARAAAAGGAAPEVDDPPEVEAAVVAAAASAKRSGRPPADRPAVTIPLGSLPAPSAGAVTTRLIAVARALDHSPVVRQALAGDDRLPLTGSSR
jgi:multisubunit Na+/H+ antiporter MnhB subunit